jgi:hypothetical protein
MSADAIQLDFRLDLLDAVAGHELGEIEPMDAIAPLSCF